MQVKQSKHIPRLYFLKLFSSLKMSISRYITVRNVKSARQKLEQYSQKPHGSCLADNDIGERQVNLQIIVPAYNVRNYLRQCMDSILTQETAYTYQVILIDDGSTDGTGLIADGYAADPRVRVIHQNNQGFSGARNAGLRQIYADYIMFCDSDDYLHQNAVQMLLEKAYRYDADVVRAGYTIFSHNGRKDRKVITDIEKCLMERSDFIEKVGGVVWGRVFKADLFQKICFPQNYWFEDTINSFLVSSFIKSVVLLPECLYFYRQHEKSITYIAKSERKVIDTYWVTELVMQERDLLNQPKNKAYYEAFLKQVIINANRLKQAPKSIQKSVFVLSCDLMTQYFGDFSFSSEKNKGLESALRKKSFRLYERFCTQL